MLQVRTWRLVMHVAQCIPLPAALAFLLTVLAIPTSFGSAPTRAVGAPEVPSTISYNMNVLVIKYFPLTPDGSKIDINVTGDVGDSYPVVRQKTIDITDNLEEALERASSYLGYKVPNAQPSLRHQVVDTQEHKEAFPIKPGTTNQPDYYRVMSDHNVCNLVDSQNVQEVWVWAYQGPQNQLAISESKMSGPFGDISNSWRLNDMPLCGQTYRVYTFNYGRGTAEALESWGHQMEAELDAVNPDFFRNLFQGPNHPEALGLTGRCGSVHNPPNARSEYDRANPSPHPSDCLDWNPDGLGSISQISCQNWGCTDNSDDDNPPLNYMIWNWQNLPGQGNAKTYQGKALRNFWDIHGDFDAVMADDRTVFRMLKGDADCNFQINAVDALAVLRRVAGLGSPSGCGNAGDVTCDGKLDVVDALLILRHVAALSVNLPAGCPTIGTWYTGGTLEGKPQLAICHWFAGPDRARNLRTPFNDELSRSIPTMASSTSWPMVGCFACAFRVPCKMPPRGRAVIDNLSHMYRTSTAPCRARPLGSMLINTSLRLVRLSPSLKHYI